MQRWRSIVGPAAFLEFLATSARTGIVTTNLRAIMNHLHDFLLHAKMIVVAD